MRKCSAAWVGGLVVTLGSFCTWGATTNDIIQMSL